MGGATLWLRRGGGLYWVSASVVAGLVEPTCDFPVDPGHNGVEVQNHRFDRLTACWMAMRATLVTTPNRSNVPTRDLYPCDGKLVGQIVN